MKKLLTICLTLALSSLCAAAATIRVPADKPNTRSAINAAADGDTVMLADGTYAGDANVGQRLQGKAITLCSENGPENCVLDAFVFTHALAMDNGENRNTVVSGLTIISGDTGIIIEDSSPTIRNCVIKDGNWGIRIDSNDSHADPLIESTLISGNRIKGIDIEDSDASIIDSVIRWNGTSSSDGRSGIFISDGTVRIVNCRIEGNATTESGGGIYCYWGSVDIINCTIVDNTADSRGGGFCTDNYSTFVVENCILAGNSAWRGDQYALVGSATWPNDLYISYSNVVGDTYVDQNCELHTGSGMIDAPSAIWMDRVRRSPSKFVPGIPRVISTPARPDGPSPTGARRSFTILTGLWPGRGPHRATPRWSGPAGASGRPIT